MKLIGSTTSPYVRKVRLLLLEQEYEFECIKALSKEGGEFLKKYSPIKRIPILIDDDQIIYDSSIISEYLVNKRGILIPIEEKIGLRLIDELCDSAITLFQQKLWEIDPFWKDERSIRMIERSNLILNELNNKMTQLTPLQQDWLFCVLDWLKFRSVIEWSKNRENLSLFYKKMITLEKFKSTSPTI